MTIEQFSWGFSGFIIGMAVGGLVVLAISDLVRRGER